LITDFGVSGFGASSDEDAAAVISGFYEACLGKITVMVAA
jgi:hypothetical protein